MKKITKEELEDKLELHQQWLENNSKGQRLDLSGFDLNGLILSGLDLRGADLSYSNLNKAELKNTDFSWATLRYSTMRDADLSGAILKGANLSCAILFGATLYNAKLEYTDFRYAEINYHIEDSLLERVKDNILSNLDYNKINKWSSIYGTEHCIAELACKLAKNGQKLKTKHGTQVAGLLLLGQEAQSHFFDPIIEVIEWFKSI